MNVVHVKQIKKAAELLGKALEGKIEYLQEVREAKEILDQMVEFKGIGIEE